MVFCDDRTRRIHEGFVVLGIPSDVQQLARRRLRMLENVVGPDEMYRVLRSGLRRRCRAERRACHAMAISRGWELRFEWRRGIALGVELVERRPPRGEAC
jgi:proteic killer suppression protein